MTSLPARPQYKDGRANTSSASSSEACVRSMAPKPRGRSVSFPTRGTMVTYVTWDVPLHGNFELRPLGATMGNVIPTPPCWGECKPNSRRRRAQVNSTIWLRELPLFGRLMLSVTLSSFGQKPKCPKSSVCTYHSMDFRKNAEHLMCDLTTKWILESAHCFSVCTYIYIVLFTFYVGGLDAQQGAVCS